MRPDVVVTFGPDGAYGHPDHVAIGQFTTAAVAAAAFGAGVDADAPPHLVRKLYYIAWAAPLWAAYEDVFKKLTSHVDGVDRQAVPWPDWAITTVINTETFWSAVWRAVSCHKFPDGRLREVEESRGRAASHRCGFCSRPFAVLYLVNGQDAGKRSVRRFALRQLPVTSSSAPSPEPRARAPNPRTANRHCTGLG